MRRSALAQCWHAGLEMVRALGLRMLEHLGYAVLVAQDGHQCLALYAEYRSRIALVLLDVTMPHLDGGETLQQLRRLDPDVRVVMMSGYTEHEMTARFAGDGLVGFIEKPYTLSALRAQLQQALESGAEEQP